MSQALLNGVCDAGVLGLCALGFGLVYISTRTFQIALGAVFTLGAFIGYSLVVSLHIAAAPAGVLVLAICFLAGAGFEIAVFRPLSRIGSSPEVAMIASLGLYTALVNAISLIWGSEARILGDGIDPGVRFLGTRLGQAQVAPVIVLVLTTAAAWLVLGRTAAGRTWRAAADNPALATVLGMDVRGARTVASGLGAAFAGLAGYLQALDLGADPNAGFAAVLAAAVATVLGGVGVFLAPVAGALLLAVLRSMVVWYGSAKWEDAVTFGLLVALLVLRPQGLLGLRRRVEES